MRPTCPKSTDLAPAIDPLIREYVDAKANELALEISRSLLDMQLSISNASRDTANKLAEQRAIINELRTAYDSGPATDRKLARLKEILKTM